MAGEILWFFGGEMGFHNVSFPTNQSYGTEGGPGFSTKIVETASGAEHRVALHNQPRHVYNAAHTIQTIADAVAVLKFYTARSGAAASFRYKDWSDYATTDTWVTYDGSAVTDTDQLLSYGNGEKTQFQLKKTYNDDGGAVQRTITLPVESSVVISFDGTPQTTGWTVNDTTGIVTFATAPDAGTVIRCGFEFEVKVRFSKEVDTNALRVAINHYEIQDIPSVPLIEVINEAPVPDSMWHGGAKNHGAITGDATITLAQAVDHTFEQSTAGLAVLLPAVTDMPDGAGHFHIHNEGTTSLDVNTEEDDLVVTLTTGKGAILSVSVNSTGGKTWRAMKGA
ncbi:MAG: DUF2460 domain-containing protein [bacterium]|nr:DUF2460 domain-containing protein [bacterium]